MENKEKIVIGFEQWLIEEGKANATIQSYVGDVKQYLNYMSEKGTTSMFLSRFSFVRYKQHLIDGNYESATINKKINSLKVFNDYLVLIGQLSEIYIRLKKDRVPIASGSEHVVTALDENEVERLLFYIEDSRKVSIRNKLIIYLLLYTGVRVSELVGIKRSEIDWLTSTLTIRGKGGKIREISLRHDVVELIKVYESTERGQSKFNHSPYLLVSQRSEKMHRDAVRGWIEKLSKDIGIRLHPHLFRHTFATRLLRKGVPPI